MANILRVSEITVFEFSECTSFPIEVDFTNEAKQLVGAVKTADPPLVVLDLTNVKYINSFFIRLLIRTWKLIKKRDGQFVIAGMSPESLEMLQQMKIDSLWKQYPTRDLAIQDLIRDTPAHFS
ncbi:MAG: hypothetical protein COA78_30365 [Blastopirellula sp.]|nr:MAG: hypothetical protein COA78_30365 [Blastopirellula sp.]